jgi:hypothetical protein
VSAGADECVRDGGSNAAARASDQDFFVGEIVHGIVLYERYGLPKRSVMKSLLRRSLAGLGSRGHRS